MRSVKPPDPPMRTAKNMAVMEESSYARSFKKGCDNVLELVVVELVVVELVVLDMSLSP